MSSRNFFIQLGILSAVTALLLLLLNSNDKISPYSEFSWICFVSFTLLTVVMFFVGRQSAQSSRKNDFINIAMGFIGGKVILAAMIIVLYSKLVEPESKLFVLPFFVVYLIYTSYETYFMMKLSKI